MVSNMPIAQERLVRLALALVLALTLACSVFLLIPTKSVSADPANDYPSNLKEPVPQDSVVDPWSFYNRECTSFVAWRLNHNNGTPFQNNNYEGKGEHFGDAWNWGSVATSIGITVDNTPAVGAVAWWYWPPAQPGDQPTGHVSWVTAINPDGSVQVQDYNWNYNGEFLDHKLTSAPTGYIHFPDPGNSGPTVTPTPTPQPSTPFAVVRDTNDIDLAYNGNDNLVWYYHWNANTGWSNLNWSDNAAGQPCVVAPDSTDLFFFYRSTTGKLMNRTWNQTSGVWTGPTALVNSGVDGDPSCLARDPNDVQAFYLSDNGSVKSISWASGTWNTNPQTLYTSGATNDSYAVSRNSDSMEVFFGKNNGNLVHVYWSAEHGWQTEDFSAGAGVTGKPSCIVRNGGNDMSCYYQENGNGKVAEQFWDVNNGWGWQDWIATLAGEPSAVVGVTNTIDDFYRETGGNIVDRSFGSSGWVTNNIEGSGSATGNPDAVSRGGFDEEVFYWNGNALMNAHYDTTNQAWSTSQLT